MKRFLQCRNVGLCMAHNRLLGFRVVRSTVSTQFLWSQFTVDAKDRIERSPEHKEKVLGYPDPDVVGRWEFVLGGFVFVLCCVLKV